LERQGRWKRSFRAEILVNYLNIEIYYLAE